MLQAKDLQPNGRNQASGSATMDSLESNDLTQTSKHYCSYDLYVDKVQKLCLEGGQLFDLVNFKRKNKFVIMAPYADPTLVWDYRLMGDLERGKKYPVLAEIAKRAALSLIKSVEETFNAKKCLSRFDSSNIGITPVGKVLFKRVQIIDDFSDEARSNTKTDTVSVLKKFFGTEVPQDLDHLLKLMNARTKGVLYSIHSSLVPHMNKGWGFIQLYEHIKRKVSRKQRNDILLKLPYHDTWRQIVTTNLVLVETYEFSPGSYDPTPGLSEVDEQLESAGLFLDFLRNGGTHRIQRSLINVACHFDLIILVLFPLLLPMLQEAFLDVLGQDGAILLQAFFRPLMLSD